MRHGYVGSANDPPNAATVAKIQKLPKPDSIWNGRKKIAHLALGVSLAAAHTHVMLNFRIQGENYIFQRILEF